MARRKKQALSVESENNTISKKVFEIGYKGLVKIKVFENDKLVSETVAHNSGTVSLFKFLGICLQGDYSEADKKRPIKIKLFNKTGNTYTEKSTFCAVANTGIKGTVNSVKNSYDVTYHFIVPYMNLYTGGDNSSLINYIMLSSSTQTPTADNHGEDNYCADVELDAESSISTAGFNQSTSLVIEWTLSILNR